MIPWSVLYAKPQKEREVAVLMAERGAREVFLAELVARPSGRLVPLFPCYLFARIDFDRVALSDVNATSGMRYVVSSAGRPQPMPEEAIELIRQRLEERQVAGWLLASRFHAGDRVRIRSGPLRYLEGIFEGWLDGHSRAVILLKFLSAASRATVDASNLEPVAPKPPRRTRGRGRRIRS